MSYHCCLFFFLFFFYFFLFLMIRRPPRSTLDRSSAASDVYKRQLKDKFNLHDGLASKNVTLLDPAGGTLGFIYQAIEVAVKALSLIHISEPTRPY